MTRARLRGPDTRIRGDKGWEAARPSRPTPPRASSTSSSTSLVDGRGARGSVEVMVEARRPAPSELLGSRMWCNRLRFPLLGRDESFSQDTIPPMRLDSSLHDGVHNGVGRGLGAANMMFISIFRIRRAPLATARRVAPKNQIPDDDVTICCLRAAKGSSFVDEFDRIGHAALDDASQLPAQRLALLRQARALRVGAYLGPTGWRPWLERATRRISRPRSALPRRGGHGRGALS